MDLGATLDASQTVTVDYGAADTKLYAAAIGAEPLSSPQFLLDRLGPSVPPSYGATVSLPALQALLADLGVPMETLLHVGQEVRLERQFEPAGKLEMRAWVAAVWDKGSAAILELGCELADRAGPLGRADCTLLVRGGGGFGGERGPSSSPPEAPDRAADRVLDTWVRPEQAALYRLCGDPNPLHVDPDAAAQAGFPAPIVHGLWTFGLATRQIVEQHAGGEVARVAAVRARFSGSVFARDTVRLSTWESPGKIDGKVVTHRNEPVLSALEVELRPASGGEETEAL